MLRVLIRIALAYFALLALGRAVLFLGYAGFEFLTPLQAYHLEPQMAHLAWRAQRGLALYPEWHEYPHVLNVFGPLYFVLIGWIGRWIDADLLGLLRIGRLITDLAGLFAASLVGWATARREGRGAGIFAALMALGAAPMVGFGAMVRSDVTADLLGFAGFLLAVRRPSGWSRWLGAALLVAAIFTKQTVGLYLIAAVVALAVTGRRRGALGLAFGAGLATLGIAALATATVEPHFARDLFGAAETPVSLYDWNETLSRVLLIAPELPILSIAGAVLWAMRRPRDLPLSVLSVVLLAGSVLMALKSGSDLNYFLGPRLVAAMAAGSIWGSSMRLVRERSDHPPPRLRIVATLAGLVVLAAMMNAGVLHILAQFSWARYSYQYLSNEGKHIVGEHRRLFRLAEDPDVSLLTDDGMVAMHQGIRAPFVDPWLFRILVLNGKIEPTEILRKLEGAEYDLLVTTHDLMAPTYLSYTFGLPPVLVEPARRSYRLDGMLAGMYLYVPRDGIVGGRSPEPADPGRAPRPGPG